MYVITPSRHEDRQAAQQGGGGGEEYVEGGVEGGKGTRVGGPKGQRGTGVYTGIPGQRKWDTEERERAGVFVKRPVLSVSGTQERYG